MTMTADDLLTHLRAERDAAEAHYKAVANDATFSDAVNPSHPMHKALRRHQDLCTAVIEVARVLGVEP